MIHMGKMLGVKTKCNQMPGRICWNTEPMPEVQYEIKFHIQNLEYENEIGEFTEDLFLNAFSIYNGVLPVIGNKYFCDEKTTTYDNKELIQYRVLVQICIDYFFITYLIKVDGVYYKPNYEEEDAQKWIDLIYENWTLLNSSAHVMQPDWYNQNQTHLKTNGITMARKVTLKEPSGIVSLLAPDNKYFYETVGRAYSSANGCACCKGAQYECVEATPTTIYVLNTASDYLRTYDDCSITVELLDYIKGFKLKCNKGEVHCVYEIYNGKNIHDRTLYLTLNNNLIKMLNCYNILNLENSRGSGGIELKIKKGLSFDANPCYNDMYYYPEWVNDTTLWACQKLDIGYDREHKMGLCDHTRAVNLSNNPHIVRLYELYEEIEQLMDEYLQKGRLDYKNVLMKHNRLDPIGELYEEFENFTNSERIIKIKDELMHFINSLNYEDIIPQKIDLVCINETADERTIEQIMKSDIMPNDIVLLINKMSDTSINGKYILLYNENNIARGYSSLNKELLLKLYRGQFSTRRLIELEQPHYSLYNDIIQQQAGFDIYHNEQYLNLLKTNPEVKQYYNAASKSVKHNPAVDMFIAQLDANLNAQDEAINAED